MKIPLTQKKKILIRFNHFRYFAFQHFEQNFTFIGNENVIINPKEPKKSKTQPGVVRTGKHVMDFCQPAKLLH